MINESKSFKKENKSDSQKAKSETICDNANVRYPNFTLKLGLMEGITIMETAAIKGLELRIANMEQMILELIKYTKSALPGTLQSSVPGYITVAEAAKKYKFSKTTIHNRINLFKKVKGRELDRLQTGTLKQVNEIELLEALKLPVEIPLIFKRKKGEI